MCYEQQQSSFAFCESVPISLFVVLQMWMTEMGEPKKKSLKRFNNEKKIIHMIYYAFCIQSPYPMRNALWLQPVQCAFQLFILRRISQMSFVAVVARQWKARFQFTRQAKIKNHLNAIMTRLTDWNYSKKFWLRIHFIAHTHKKRWKISINYGGDDEVLDDLSWSHCCHTRLISRNCWNESMVMTLVSYSAAFDVRLDNHMTIPHMRSSWGCIWFMCTAWWWLMGRHVVIIQSPQFQFPYEEGKKIWIVLTGMKCD